MKMKKLLYLIPAFAILTSCDNAGQEGGEETPVQEEVKQNQDRPEAPVALSISRYKTSPEDSEGTLLSKEVYNEDGLKIEYVGYDYYGSGEVDSKTAYEYDENGNLVKMTDLMGQKTVHTYTYDENGNKTEETWSRENGQGQKTEFVYNEQGDVTEMKYYTPDGTYDFSRTREYTYDDQGNITSEIGYEKYTDGSADLHQFHVTSKFNEDGKLVETGNVREDGYRYSYTVMSYDGAGNHTESIEYDGNDEVQSREVYEFNEYGEVVKDMTYSGMDVLNYTNTYEHDQYGNQVSMMYVHEDGDAWGERTVFEYKE